MSAALWCALLAAGAVALALPPSTARQRLAVVSGAAVAAPAPGRGAGVRALLGSRLAAALVAGVGAAAVLGGWVGVLAGPLVTVAAHRFLSGLEPAAARRRRLRIAADLPLAVDLAAVCLEAGRPVGPTVSVVAAAIGGPLGQELGRVGSRMQLGADPAVVWADTGRDPALGPLARAVVRALDTGAPLAGSLTRLADDLRAERRASVDETARRVAVRSAGPLGLCFLPAFVLVGIVPTIIGAFRGVLG